MSAPGPPTRPGWHRAVYALVAVIAVLFLWLILDRLTDRIVAAEASANVALDGATQLAAQVEDLGGTPVVDPGELPTPERGETGATGAAGAAGADGQDGTDGARGPRGFVGPVGPAGPPGVDGDTITGPEGPAGPAGAQGPAGDPGPTGPAGEQGPRGETGPQGPAGPVCPPGYSAAERTVFTSDTPQGERVIVCTEDTQDP